MTTTITPSSATGLDTVAELAAQLRVDSIRPAAKAGSGAASGKAPVEKSAPREPAPTQPKQ